MGKFNINLTNMTMFKRIWLLLGVVWITALLTVGWVAFGADIIKPAAVHPTTRPPKGVKVEQLPADMVGRAIYRIGKQPLIPLGAGAGAVLATIAVFGFFSYASGQQRKNGQLATKSSRTYLITLAAEEVVSIGQMMSAWLDLHTSLASPQLQKWLGKGTHVVISYIGKRGGRYRVGCYATIIGSEQAGKLFIDRLLALNPTMQAKEVPNPRPGGTMLYTELRLALSSKLSIRKEFDKDADPLALLARLIQGDDQIETMGVDFLLRPSEGNAWATAGRSERDKLKQAAPAQRNQQAIAALDKVDDDRWGFDCRIRVYGIGEAGAVTKAIQLIARDYFGAFKLDNYFIARPIVKGNPGLGYPVTFEDSSVLAPKELAGVCHIPSATYAKGLAVSPARYIAPHQSALSKTPVAGVSVPTVKLVRLPKTSTRDYDFDKPIQIGWDEGEDGKRRLVSVTRRALGQHCWGCGPTGSGKSWWIAAIALQHCYNQDSVVVIEPHGDLVKDIEGRLDRADWGRVVDIDPKYTHKLGRIFTLNPMEVPRRNAAADVAGEVISILRQLAAGSWESAPRMAMLVGMSVRTLLSASKRVTGRDASITHIIPFLTKQDFRDPLAAGVREQNLAEYWGEIYPSYPEKERISMAQPVITRLNGILADEYASDMMTYPTSTLNIRRLIDNNFIILATLPKAGDPEDGADPTTSMIAKLIFIKVLNGAMARVQDYPVEADRPMTWLFVDEAQSVIKGAKNEAEAIISEARKAHLSASFFNQVPSQLDPGTLDILTGQAALNLAWAALNDKAAKMLAENSLGRKVSAYDVMNLPAYETYTRAEVDKEKLVFSMKALPLESFAEWAYPKVSLTNGYQLVKQEVTAASVTQDYLTRLTQAATSAANPPAGGIAVNPDAVEKLAGMVQDWLDKRRATVEADQVAQILTAQVKDAASEIAAQLAWQRAEQAARDDEEAYDITLDALIATDRHIFDCVRMLCARRDTRLARWVQENPGCCAGQVEAVKLMSMLVHCVPYILIRAANRRATGSTAGIGTAGSGVGTGAEGPTWQAT